VEGIGVNAVLYCDGMIFIAYLFVHHQSSVTNSFYIVNSLNFLAERAVQHEIEMNRKSTIISGSYSNSDSDHMIDR